MFEVWKFPIGMVIGTFILSFLYGMFLIYRGHTGNPVSRTQVTVFIVMVLVGVYFIYHWIISYLFADIPVIYQLARLMMLVLWLILGNKYDNLVVERMIAFFTK